MNRDNPFALLRQRRFGPYFASQFLGAFNDNLFKNALVVLIAFRVQDSAGLSSHTLINLAAGLFILPFFLFSASAGELADHYDKAWLMRRIKAAEIAIMALGAVGFWLGDPLFLIGVLFLMGTQSAFFGPAKYGLLPQHLQPDELLGGNSLVGGGTFVAILFGTIVGSQLIVREAGDWLVSAGVLAVAALGYLASRSIPPAPPANSTKVHFQPFRGTRKLLRALRETPELHRGVLGISWFWFVGATYLAQLPNFVKLTFGGNVNVFTLLLTCFAVGIALGALACQWLSPRRIAAGLVPLGGLGISLFGADLALAAPATAAGDDFGISVFLASDGGLRSALDVLLIGVSGGLFIVPLNALIQQRAAPARRARVIAANNVLNALAMVGSAVAAIGLLGVAGLSIPTLFALLAATNLLVLIWLCRALPELPLRCLGWLLLQRHRLRSDELDVMPREAALLIDAPARRQRDALLIYAAIPRACRPVLPQALLRGMLGWLWQRAGALATSDHDAQIAALRKGEAVCRMDGATGELVDYAPLRLCLDYAPARLHRAAE